MRLITLKDIYSGNRPYIVLWTRDGPTRTQTVIKTFKPYFYILPEESPENYPGTNVTDWDYPSLKGTKVSKFEVSTPNDVPQYIKLFSKTWEDDIKFRTRYLIDKIDELDLVNLRIQYTDIEQSMKTQEITSLAVYDNYLGKVVCFVQRKDFTPGKMERKYSFLGGFTFNASIYKFKTEEELLKSYVKFLRSTDPDILTGWFFINYDMVEIVHRLNQYKGLGASKLSPIGRCYISTKRYGPKVICDGRVLVDMLRAYSRLQQGELKDESLEAVSQDVLGEGKVEHDLGLDDLWQQDIEKFVEYNCKDAVLVYRIDEKAQVLSYYDTMRRFCGANWENMYSGTQLWDIYMLRKVKGRCVLPSRRTKKIPRIPGAKIFQPSKGIHKWVCLLDLNSLYPAIIITFNMSPETILSEPSKNCNILKNGIIFNKDKIGLLPEMLLELFALRKEYKDKMDEYPFETTEWKIYYNLQYAVKRHMNKLYGAMLYKNFRLSTREIGESITFCGREIIKWIRKKVQEYGFKVLYGDTDSVFYFSKKDNIPNIVEEFTEIVRKLNEELPKKIEELGGDPGYCKITIAPEKIYQYLLMTLKKDKSGEAAKKCYAGRVRWAGGKLEDKVEIKGMALKKSNASQLTKDLGEKILDCIFGYEPLENLKIYIKRAKDIIKSDSLIPQWSYFGIPQGISDLNSYKIDNPWSRGSKYSNEYLGETFSAGDKPKICYVRQVPAGYPKTDVAAYRRKLPDGFKVDVKKMIEKVITMKLGYIFESAGLSFEEYLHGQSSLDRF